MAAKPTPLVAGNWKMNGLCQSMAELARMIRGSKDFVAAELMICPPATLVLPFATEARGSRIAIGAQDCHAQASGAFTGDISAEMLADAGAAAIIVGHSERRTTHQETNADVHAKARAVWRAGLPAIACIGETKAERDAGRTLDVVGTQLAGSIPDGATAGNLVVAYEPVWAIGSGLTPTHDDIVRVHAAIRQALASRFGGQAQAMRILYGGSVKPANAGEILGLANVDGALIGGASLKADDFLAIAGAYRPV